MPLTTRTRVQLVDKINTCFTNIGTNGTKMPKSGDNRESFAWDMWLGYHLARLANKRKANAEDAAVKAGLIFDKKTNPRPSGTKAVLFNGELVSIAVEVRKAATHVDTDKLLAFLASKKVPAKVLAEAIEYATEESRAAHIFDPVLITDDEL
jgi:hypothetical protein